MVPDASELERPDCPLCGGARHRQRYRLAPYGVVQCLACGFHFLSPRLREAEMLRLYREGAYFEGSEEAGYTSYRAQETALRATFRRLLHELERADKEIGLVTMCCGGGLGTATLIQRL